jgi:hypothetical protein
LSEEDIDMLLHQVILATVPTYLRPHRIDGQ